MIEAVLMNYGVLGIWTATLLYDKISFQTKMLKLIAQNTIELKRRRK